MSKKRIVDARSPEYSALGYKITEARKALGLSQAEASKRIGIPQSTYSGYETGTRKVTLTTLKQIAAAYGVDVDTLIGTPKKAVSLSEETERVLQCYMSADEQTRQMVKRLLSYYEKFKALSEEYGQTEGLDANRETSERFLQNPPTVQ